MTRCSVKGVSVGKLRVDRVPNGEVVGKEVSYDDSGLIEHRGVLRKGSRKLSTPKD